MAKSHMNMNTDTDTETDTGKIIEMNKDKNIGTETDTAVDKATDMVTVIDMVCRGCMITHMDSRAGLEDK